MLPGGTGSRAWAINDDGVIVGDMQGSFGQVPVVWENGEVRALASWGWAWDINNLGQVVGDDGTRGYVWDQGATYDLGAQSHPKGIDDHSEVVGYVQVYDYQQATYWEMVPEPGCIASLLTGLAFAGVLLRRRAARS